MQVKDVTDSSALVTWSPPVAEVDAISLAYAPVGSEPEDGNSTEVSLAYGPEDSNSTEISLGYEDSNSTEVELPSSSSSQYSLDALQPDTLYQITLTSRRGNSTSLPVTQTFTTGQYVKPLQSRVGPQGKEAL